MSKFKFKVGDRVVHNVHFKTFGLGTVVKLRKFGDYVVKFDKAHEDLHHGDMDDGLKQYWYCVESDLELAGDSEVKENPASRIKEDTCVRGRSLPTGFSFTLDIDNRMEMGEYYITNELGTYRITVDKVE